MSTVTCGYCAEVFTEDQGQPTCAACPIRGGCQMVRCPRCGYENPSEPEWMARIRRWLQSREGRKGGQAQDTRGAVDARAGRDVR